MQQINGEDVKFNKQTNKKTVYWSSRVSACQKWVLKEEVQVPGGQSWISVVKRFRQMCYFSGRACVTASDVPLQPPVKCLGPAQMVRVYKEQTKHIFCSQATNKSFYSSNITRDGKFKYHKMWVVVGWTCLLGVMWEFVGAAGVQDVQANVPDIHHKDKKTDFIMCTWLSYPHICLCVCVCLTKRELVMCNKISTTVERTSASLHGRCELEKGEKTKNTFKRPATQLSCIMGNIVESHVIVCTGNRLSTVIKESSRNSSYSSFFIWPQKNNLQWLSPPTHVLIHTHAFIVHVREQQVWRFVW